MALIDIHAIAQIDQTATSETLRQRLGYIYTVTTQDAPITEADRVEVQAQIASAWQEIQTLATIPGELLAGLKAAEAMVEHVITQRDDAMRELAQFAALERDLIDGDLNNPLVRRFAAETLREQGDTVQAIIEYNDEDMHHHLVRMLDNLGLPGQISGDFADVMLAGGDYNIPTHLTAALAEPLAELRAWLRGWKD
jgi:hypothetical protein